MPVSAVRNRPTFQAKTSFEHGWYVADVGGKKAREFFHARNQRPSVM